jgi:ABC-type thiamine transport system substrate-binding protein
VFTYTNELDAHTVVLAALANGSGLLKLVFDKKKLKGRKKRLEQLTKGNVAGKATREAIEAMQAAVVATMVATTVAVTATH